MSFLQNLFNTGKTIFNGLRTAFSSSPVTKLGTFGTIAHKVGQASQFLNKIGVGGKVTKTLSSLPLSDIGSHIDKAVDVGKGVLQTAKDIRNSVNRPVLQGDDGVPTVNIDDI